MRFKENLNAFTCYLSGDWKWNLRHPFKTLKALQRGLRAAWQRATRGFSDYDLYDWDNWMLELLPSSLEEFARVNQAYPDYEEMDAFDKWQNYLKGLAADFRICQDPEAEDRNEYYEEYTAQFNDKSIHMVGNHERTEIDDKYFARAKELSKEQQQLLEDTFARLAKWFYAIWW